MWPALTCIIIAAVYKFKKKELYDKEIFSGEENKPDRTLDDNTILIFFLYRKSSYGFLILFRDHLYLKFCKTGAKYEEKLFKAQRVPILAIWEIDDFGKTFL